jgi:hypothetical protein
MPIVPVLLPGRTTEAPEFPYEAKLEITNKLHG